jgi:phosphatidylinositol-3-phosphatase
VRRRPNPPETPAGPSGAGQIAAAIASLVGGAGLAWWFSRQNPATIFTIPMENHSYSQIIGNPACPYMNQLAQQYASATNYRSPYHPSLPNYLIMTSGSSQGVTDDLYHLIDAPNVFSQMDDAGIPWRSYSESMGSPCRTSDGSLYASRHNPAVYFQSVTGKPDVCANRVVDMSNLWGDLAANAVRYAWITPNLQDDMHDGTPAAADSWLQGILPQIMQSPGYLNGGVVFIIWDEGDESGASADPNQLPAIVVAPNIVGAPLSDPTPYDHRSYLAAVQDLMGLARLPTTAGVNSMASMISG